MPSTVRAWLLSNLGMQLLRDRDRFAERHGCAALVWEPGTWSSPAGRQATMPPMKIGLAAPPKGDALVFELPDTAGALVRVGRADDNDVVINDATVSRQQLALQLAADGWTVTLASAAKPAKRNGLTLDERPVPLAAGDQLEVGQARLTFLDPAGLFARVDALAGGSKK